MFQRFQIQIIVYMQCLFLVEIKYSQRGDGASLSSYKQTKCDVCLQNTVEAGYNEVPGTFRIALLYVVCVITEASDIMSSCYATCYI